MNLISLRKLSVMITHHRLVSRAREAADPKPREAAFPTKVVDPGICRDPVEPRQHAMLFGQRAEGLVGLRENVLRQIVRYRFM